MNKRIKKKRNKNKIEFEKAYNLKKLTGSVNNWDSSPSYNGELYRYDKFIISFYEDSVEGGYYPSKIYSQNTILSNQEKIYKQFLNATKSYINKDISDELELFHQGISILMKKVDCNNIKVV